MAYSEEARRKAIDAYLAGASLEHAGAMVGATGTSVHNWLMREGVPRRGVGRQPPDGGRWLTRSACT